MKTIKAPADFPALDTLAQLFEAAPVAVTIVAGVVLSALVASRLARFI